MRFTARRLLIRRGVRRRSAGAGPVRALPIQSHHRHSRRTQTNCPAMQRLNNNSRASCSHSLALAVALLAFLSTTPAIPLPFRLKAETLQDISERLQTCWVPPLQNFRPGTEITIRVAFKANGAILGRPRITFETPDATESQRLSYRISIAEMLERCTPVPMSPSLGAAIAGRPFAIRFKDKRIPRPRTPI